MFESEDEIEQSTMMSAMSPPPGPVCRRRSGWPTIPHAQAAASNSTGGGCDPGSSVPSASAPERPSSGCSAWGSRCPRSAPPTPTSGWPAGVEDVWRGHVPAGEGRGEVLDRARRDRGVEVVLRTPGRAGAARRDVGQPAASLRRLRTGPPWRPQRIQRAGRQRAGGPGLVGACSSSPRTSSGCAAGSPALPPAPASSSNLGRRFWWRTPGMPSPPGSSPTTGARAWMVFDKPVGARCRRLPALEPGQRDPRGERESSPPSRRRRPAGRRPVDPRPGAFCGD